MCEDTPVSWGTAAAATAQPLRELPFFPHLCRAACSVPVVSKTQLWKATLKLLSSQAENISREKQMTVPEVLMKLLNFSTLSSTEIASWQLMSRMFDCTMILVYHILKKLAVTFLVKLFIKAVYFSWFQENFFTEFLVDRHSKYENEKNLQKDQKTMSSLPAELQKAM